MRALGSLLVTVATLAACHHSEPALVPTTGDVAPLPSPPPDPGTRPAEADPAPRTEGAFTEAWVHGLHVLVKRVPGAEATATELVIRGGVRNWGKADAGIEQLALATAVSGGTEHAPKDAFTQRLSELGSTLTAQSGPDWSGLVAWSLTPAWDETFRLLVEAFRHPALPAAEIELQRHTMLAALHQEQDSPDAKLTMLSRLALYRGHPYENRPSGTLASVQALTAGQLRTHLDKLRESSRLALVVVGDVDAARVIAAVGAAFGDLPRGAYQDTPLPALHVAHGAVVVVDQKLPTTYITAITTGPRWDDPDFVALQVGLSALYEREFQEVRTKRNLSYAPSAFMRIGTASPVIGLYVTAVDPATTMPVMLAEAKRLRDEPIPATELEATKSKYLTAVLMGQETALGQVEDLVTALVLGGDWRALENRAAKVHAVTAAQIQASAQKHFTHLQTTVLGDGSKVDRPALEGF